MSKGGLVDAGAVRVGHATGDGTGVTVIHFPHGAICGVDVRGAAPGTRETDLLDPVNTVQSVNAIVLTGGSAFGLAAASGVMNGLAEQGEGLDTGFGVVPIVPAAVIFDLPLSATRPDEAMGRAALAAASETDASRGNVGAGTGATIGKYLGRGFMKGGLGQATITHGDLNVSALMVVNALGDIYDGDKIAGASDDGLIDTDTFADSTMSITNTTIGVVATNAALSKAEATRVAMSAHDGLARAIIPTHTSDDGDVVFAASTGSVQAPLRTVCYLATEAVRLAILDGVRSATSLPGIPACSEL